MRLGRRLALALLATMAVAQPAGAARLEPQILSCITAPRYRQAQLWLDRAERAASLGAFTQSRRIADQGIRVLGQTYWREEPPSDDATDQQLNIARDLARTNKPRDAAEETVGVLADRLRLYRRFFGDPKASCK